MKRFKTFLLCLCVILAVFPAAGSSDDSQNATISDDTLIEEDIEETPEEPIQEVPAEEPVIVPEPKTPEQIEPELEGAEVIQPVTPDEPEIIEDPEPCPITEESEGCPVIEEEDKPCPEIIEPEPPISPETPKPACPTQEPKKVCQAKPEPKPVCDVPEVSEGKCPVTVKPKPACPVKVSEKKCPAVVKPKPTCPKIIDQKTTCPGKPKPGVPPVVPEPPITPEPEDPVTPEDPEPELPPVTPEDPIEEPEEDQDKITTVKLCKDNVCTVGANGKILSITNYASAKDVSYAELLAFLKEDKTDELPYTNTFQCGDFAVLLHNNAEKAGIKAGFEGANGCKHAYNLFNTTDKGLVRIDCTGAPGGRTLQDKRLDVAIGKPMTGAYLFRNGGTLDMGCTVTSLVTYW